MTRPKVITEDGESVDKLAAVQDEAVDDLDGIRVIELVPGTSVRVLPPRMWRVSGLKGMRQADFEMWAKKCLASSEDYEIFMDVDPTLEQIEAFMKRLNEESGEGNRTTSSTLSRRSKSTRKR
jgi:hypothetical protein